MRKRHQANRDFLLTIMQFYMIYFGVFDNGKNILSSEHRQNKNKKIKETTTFFFYLIRDVLFFIFWYFFFVCGILRLPDAHLFVALRVENYYSDIHILRLSE